MSKFSGITTGSSSQEVIPPTGGPRRQEVLADRRSHRQAVLAERAGLPDTALLSDRPVLADTAVFMSQGPLRGSLWALLYLNLASTCSPHHTHPGR